MRVWAVIMLAGLATIFAGAQDFLPLRDGTTVTGAIVRVSSERVAIRTGRWIRAYDMDEVDVVRATELRMSLPPDEPPNGAAAEQAAQEPRRADSYENAGDAMGSGLSALLSGHRPVYVIGDASGYTAEFEIEDRLLGVWTEVGWWRDAWSLLLHIFVHSEAREATALGNFRATDAYGNTGFIVRGSITLTRAQFNKINGANFDPQNLPAIGEGFYRK